MDMSKKRWTCNRIRTWLKKGQSCPESYVQDFWSCPKKLAMAGLFLVMSGFYGMSTFFWPCPKKLAMSKKRAIEELGPSPDHKIAS
jgi:hypothetical protein